MSMLLVITGVGQCCYILDVCASKLSLLYASVATFFMALLILFITAVGHCCYTLDDFTIFNYHWCRPVLIHT